MEKNKTMDRIKEIFKLLDQREEKLIEEFLVNGTKNASDKVDYFIKESKRFEKAAKKIEPYEMTLRILCDIIHEYDADEIVRRFELGVYTDPRP